MAAGILATLKVVLTGDTSQLDKEMQAAQKRIETFGNKLTGIGKKMTVGLTLPLAIAGGAAIKMASDFEESLNKVKVVFGPAAQEVINFSQTAATNLGMSSQAALDAAGTFGNLFTAMGMSQGPAAQMSTDLLQLAADLASFNNLDPTEVFEKLRSGLVGEAEPLRTLGVNINEATVKAKALEMGLADTADALTMADKVTARYALIMEQTTTAQGDFARTSEGLANQMRIMKASITNAGASIGSVMLPVVQKVVGWITQLTTWLGKLSPQMRTVVVVIGLVVAAIGPLLMIIGTLISSIGTIGAVIGPVIGVLSGPVLLVIGAVVAAIALLTLAWNTNWFGFRDTVMLIWDGYIKPALQTLWNWLQVNIPIALQALSGFWTNTLLPAIRQVWTFLQTYIFPIFQTLAQIIATVVVANIKLLAWVWTSVLWPALQAVWNFFQAYILPILSLLAQIIATVVVIAVRALAAVWQNVILPALTAVWSFIQTKILPIFKDIADWITLKLMPVLQPFANLIGNVLVASFQALKGAIDWIIQKFQKLLDLLKKVADAIKRTKTLGDSPSPWETSLYGIAGAMEHLNKFTLPDMENALAEMNYQLPMGAAGRGNPTTNNYFNQTIYTNSPAEPAANDFNMLRARARA